MFEKINKYVCAGIKVICDYLFTILFLVDVRQYMFDWYMLYFKHLLRLYEDFQCAC